MALRCPWLKMEMSRTWSWWRASSRVECVRARAAGPRAEGVLVEGRDWHVTPPDTEREERVVDGGSAGRAAQHAPYRGCLGVAAHPGSGAVLACRRYTGPAGAAEGPCQSARRGNGVQGAARTVPGHARNGQYLRDTRRPG